jgi:hypothetical protein
MKGAMYTFVVTPHGDEPPYEIKAGSSAIALWEDTGHQNSLKRLVEATRMKDLYALAHVAAKQQQLPAGQLTLAQFRATTELKTKDTVKGLERDELIEVITKAIENDGPNPELIADEVMDLLESLASRDTDPTRPAL